MQDVPAMNPLDAKCHLLQNVLRLCQAEDQPIPVVTLVPLATPPAGGGG